MAQIFHPSMKVVFRASIILTVIVGGAGVVGGAMYRSGTPQTSATLANNRPVQPRTPRERPGISCGYCTPRWNSRRSPAFRRHTCMTCHSQIWNTARCSSRCARATDGNTARVDQVHTFRTSPISTIRSTSARVSDARRHGRVDKMPLTWSVNTLHMSWCLDCHRAPENISGRRAKSFDDLDTGSRPAAEGAKLVEENHIRTKHCPIVQSATGNPRPQ